MRNIFLFIRRYFNFFAFLVLQFIALSFLFRYNKHHRASFLGIANEITGRVNKQYDKLDDYFHQGEENQRVHRMNDSLLNLLPGNYAEIDTLVRAVVDTLKRDSLITYRRYIWRSASVVNNSVTSQSNFIQIDKGASHGIRDDMGVLNSDLSLVGIVVNVSENFSQVRSLLHIKSKVSVALKRSGNTGTVSWDGKNPLYLTLTGIPKSDSIYKGDTVVTGYYSLSFPAGHVVGYIDGIEKDNTTSFYRLRIKTAANFLNLQQVFVVENLQREEQEKLEKETLKEEQSKRSGQ